MKVINREQLAAMPSYTLWSFYKPHVIEGLHMKVEKVTISGQWFWDNDLIESLEWEDEDDRFEAIDKLSKGESVNVDYEQCIRESLWEHDEDQMYIVYEDEDIKRLITALQKCIKE